MKVFSVFFVFALAIGTPIGYAQSTSLTADTTRAHQLYAQALSWQKKAQYLKANKLLGKASERYDKHQQWAKKLECQNGIARNLIDIGKYDEALQAATQVLQESQRQLGEQHLQVANACNTIGISYDIQGLYDPALANFQQSLQIRIKVLGEIHPQVAASYNNIGIVYYNKGEYDQALVYQQQALQIRRKTLPEQHPDLAASYSNLGLIYVGKGELEQARTYHLEALQQWGHTLGETHPQVAGAYNNIGTTYELQGVYDQALHYYQQALHVWMKKAGKSHPVMAACYTNIGNIYYNKGEYNQALTFHQQSLTLLKRSKHKQHPDLARTYNNLGDTYQKLLDYDKALQAYQQAMMANVFSFQEQHPSVNPTAIHQPENYLSGLLLLSSLERKIHVWRLRFSTSHAVQDLHWAYQTCLLADTLAQQVQGSFWDEKDKMQFSEHAVRGYQDAVWVCNQLYQSTKDKTYLEQAFHFAERGKASVMLASFHESRARTFAGIPDSLLAKDRRLRTELARYGQEVAIEVAKGNQTEPARLHTFQSRLFTVRQQQEALIRQFEREYPAYFRLKYQSVTRNPAQIQAVLDPQTALVEYVLTDTALHRFILTHTGFELQTVRVDSSFMRQVTALRESMLVQDRDFYQSVAYHLYQHLWPSSLPSAIQHVIIVPDERLYTIPFEALLTHEEDAQAYLVKKYSISYAYSASVLYEQLARPTSLVPKQLMALAPVFADAQTNTPPGNSRSLLAHHGPTTRFTGTTHQTKSPVALRGWLLDGRYVSPLPASEEEVQAIANLFTAKGGQSAVYLHKQAREETVKKTNLLPYTYLHFATHGLVNESRPELSGIMLAQDSTAGEDGILYTGEIYTLQLDAELVTLSACETGLGKIAKGEGIIGLTRALLYAGARNVAVSLWQVSDESTAYLMKQFYQYILAGEGKASALRKAKLNLLEQKPYAQPYFWAPFVLVGY